VWAGVVVLALVGAGRARFMIVCQRLVCWRVRMIGAQQHGGVSGAEAEPGGNPPVLEVAEAVLDWGAGGGQGLVRVSLGGGGLPGSGGFVSGDDDRVVRVGVEAGEPEVGQVRPEGQ
jgi:hypothetical protein